MVVNINIQRQALVKADEFGNDRDRLFEEQHYTPRDLMRILGDLAEEKAEEGINKSHWAFVIKECKEYIMGTEKISIGSSEPNEDNPKDFKSMGLIGEARP